VIVGIDASPASRATLRAAGELASSWGAEVCGVFVEDMNLLRWASLPFARAVSRSSAGAVSVDRADVELLLRKQAADARRELEQSMVNRPVRHSFRVARGSVTEELLASLLDTDFVSIGKGRPAEERLGSTAHSILSRLRGRVLFTPPMVQSPSQVVVVYDDSPEGTDALAVGVNIAGGRRITVVCVAKTAAEYARLQQNVAELLGERQDAVRYLRVPPADLAGTADLAFRLGANLLVLPGRRGLLSSTALEAAVNQFPGAVLVTGPCREGRG
jgi:hypothetical protein